MEETEVGEVDKVGEEAAEHAQHHAAKAPWMRYLALSTAFFAVMAAIASLLSGQFANEAQLHVSEATLKQAQASDQWAFYQSKSMKAHLSEMQSSLLTTLKGDEVAIKKVEADGKKYRGEGEKIIEEAKKLEEERDELRAESDHELHTHHGFAYVVTTLQVAIGLSAIAALVERKSLWLTACAAGLIGIALFVMALLTMKHEKTAKHEGAKTEASASAEKKG